MKLVLRAAEPPPSETQGYNEPMGGRGWNFHVLHHTDGFVQSTFGARLFAPTHPFFCSRFFANGNPFLMWPSLSLCSDPGGRYSLTLPWLPHFEVKSWSSSEPRIYGMAVQTQETPETEKPVLPCTESAPWRRVRDPGREWMSGRPWQPGL